MVGVRGVRLGVLASEFVLGEMREEDGGCGCGGKRPLHEVDWCACVGCRPRTIFWCRCNSVGSVSVVDWWQTGQDEVRVPPCCTRNGLVDGGGHGRA